MKIYVKDEDQISKEFCDMMCCEGEQPTESDPSGCTGCDAQEKYIEENYDRVVSESDKDIFFAVDELKETLGNTRQFACLESWCASRHKEKEEYCRNCKDLNKLLLKEHKENGR